jgi:hypothetical protein
LKKDSAGNVDSISVSGTVAGGTDQEFTFIGKFKTTLTLAAQGVLIFTPLTGDQEAPDPVTTPGKGAGLIVVNLDTGSARGSVSFSGLTSNAAAAHFHQGAFGTAGPVIITLEGGATGTQGVWHVPAGTTLNAEQLAALQAGNLYFNVHSANFPGGEIRGQIALTNITAPLNGGQEVPRVTTEGTGTGTLTVNHITRAISGSIVFSELTSNSTEAHIHQNAAGANGPVIVPLTGGDGVTSGTYTIPDGTVLTQDQFAALVTNNLYFNVHTSINPGGEIRGQILFTP